MTIDLVFNFVQISTAITLTVVLWRMILKNERKGPVILAAAFLAFALIALAMSDLYWLAFGLMRPENRMPFSASEIGECGVLLLLSASLSSYFTKKRGDHGALSLRVLLPSFLFAAVNTALWIGWNGSYVTNVLSGLSLWVLSAVCLDALRRTRTPGRTGWITWIALGVWSTLLLALQGTTFLVSENVSAVLDAVCYVLIFSAQLFFLVTIVLCFVRRTPAARLYASACTWQCLSLSSLYMSAGVMYTAVYICMTASFVFIVLAFRRAAAETVETAETAGTAETVETVGTAAAAGTPAAANTAGTAETEGRV